MNPENPSELPSVWVRMSFAVIGAVLSFSLLTLATGCGDNMGAIDTPDAALPAPQVMPSCSSMQCDPTIADRRCVDTGVCACQPPGTPRGTPKETCAPRCIQLACAALACDEAALCTCELGSGYVTCADE